MNDFEFILSDRIAKIQSINTQFDLLKNSYISFSGGKDSTILHYLIDLALPNNNIPRVFFNTGIEYTFITQFVKDLSKNDKRFIIVNSNVNIPIMLKINGYPFKSKEHSNKLSRFNKNGMTPYIERYLNGINYNGSSTTFKCPNILKFQFDKSYNLFISDKCCFYLKKNISHNWSIVNNKSICITGMRKAEKGHRTHLSCLSNHNTKFNPLSVVDDNFENDFITFYNIKLCKLYYSPYNFKRTGCKGCPYSLSLFDNLILMKRLLPNEYKQCLHLWKPVYDEYVRLGYRLPKNFYSLPSQFSIFDYIF